MKSIRTFEIREKDPKNIKIITDFLMSYRHAENMILILISDLFKDFQSKSDEEKSKSRRISSLLLNFMVMKSVLSKNRGKKLAEAVEELNSYYESNQIFQNLVTLCSDNLNSHNMSMILRRLKSNFSTVFKGIKKNLRVNFPKPKKLRFLNKMSLPLEAGKFSVYKQKISLHKKKTTLGLTLGKKQILVFLGECDYIKTKEITSVTVGYSNGEIYYHLSYEKMESGSSRKSEDSQRDMAKSCVRSNFCVTLCAHIYAASTFWSCSCS